MRRRSDVGNPDFGMLAEPPPRRGEQPYVFAYDISEPKRSRQVLKCLREWRSDGQLSVHEAWLAPDLAETLAVEALDLIDPATDRLLLARLSRRGGSPVLALSRAPLPAPLLGQPREVWPARLSGGCYLVAYDIREEQRLRQVQRVSARHCLFLQRSVYFYSGGGGTLARFLAEIGRLIDRGEDDVRLYVLNGPADLWFLAGPDLPLADLSGAAPKAARRTRLSFPHGDFTPWL